MNASLLRNAALVVAASLSVACGGSAEHDATLADDGAALGAPPIADENIYVPASYNGSKPVALLVWLHTFESYGWEHAAQFGLLEVAEKQGFIVALPNAPDENHDGMGHWNATAACCSMPTDDPARDDVAYLNQVIEHVRGKFKIDHRKIYAIGWSNGAFMAHALACSSTSSVTGVVSVFGATHKNPALCNPSRKVSVVQVNLLDDPIVDYDGGLLFGGNPYPGAVETTGTWAAKNGCSGALQANGTMELDATQEMATGNGPDHETTASKVSGCPVGVNVQLWTVRHSTNHFQFPFTLRTSALVDGAYGVLSGGK